MENKGFQNTPQLKNQEGNSTVKRYVHQPLTVEHFGIHAKIQENGKIVITGPPVKTNDGEVEFDEVEIPASLVFKLATLLKATRSVKFVAVGEVQEIA